MTDDEWNKFKEENPELARYFESEDPNVIEELEVPEVPEST